MARLILPDVTLNHEVLGTGKPVTMIHGLAANMAFWYLGAARLMAPRAEMLMYDLRGHGRSTMPATGYTLDHMVGDLEALLDDRGIARTNLIGHSYGARVALAFAAKNPDRIDTLTIADTQIRCLQPSMRIGDWPFWQKWKLELAAQGHTNLPDDDALIDFRLLADLGETIGASGGGAAKRQRRQINMRSRAMGDRGRETWKKLLTETSAKAELHDETALNQTMLAEIEAPTMLMYGKLSHCVPTSDALLDLVPDARRLIVPGAGHFFPVVKAGMFARAYMQFLDIAAERRRTGLGLRKRRRLDRLRARAARGGVRRAG